MCKLFERNVQHKKIKLIIHIDERIPKYIISDKNRIIQILLNLVGNSIKFTKKGYVKIKITRVDSADGKKFTPIISVIDSGIGIK